MCLCSRGLVRFLGRFRRPRSTYEYRHVHSGPSQRNDKPFPLRFPVRQHLRALVIQELAARDKNRQRWVADTGRQGRKATDPVLMALARAADARAAFACKR